MNMNEIVVNDILTGKKDEIAPWMASHMDIDGLDISGLDAHFHGKEIITACVGGGRDFRIAFGHFGLFIGQICLYLGKSIANTNRQVVLAECFEPSFHVGS